MILKVFLWHTCIGLFLITALNGQGSLVLVGGGSESDRSDAWNAQAYQYIADKASDGLVILSRSDNSDWLPDYFRSLGVSEVRNMQIQTHGLAEIAAAITDASGVFLKGGDQRDYISAWNNSEVEDALKALFQRGGVLAGTSAGAMSLSTYISTGDHISEENLRDMQSADNTYVSDFLSLMPGLIVDTHYSERGRMGRLMATFARVYAEQEASNLMGIGIDDKTAVIIDEHRKMFVHGSGMVQLLRAGHDFRVQNVQAGPLWLEGLKVHQLIEGYEVDLNTFEIEARPEQAVVVDALESSSLSFPNFGWYQDLNASAYLEQVVQITDPNQLWVVVGNADYSSLQAAHNKVEVIGSAELASNENWSTWMQQDPIVWIDLSVAELNGVLLGQSVLGQMLHQLEEHQNVLWLFRASLGPHLQQMRLQNLNRNAWASYDGEFEEAETFGLLKKMHLSEGVFRDGEFDENQMSAPFWLMHRNQDALALLATDPIDFILLDGTLHYLEAEASKASIIVIDATKGYSSAQSEYVLSGRNRRHAVSISAFDSHVLAPGSSQKLWEQAVETSIAMDQLNALDQLPTVLSIISVYPNPFNPSTQLAFRLTQKSRIELSIFNSNGQRIQHQEGVFSKGEHRWTLQMQHSPSGVYFIRLRSEDGQVHQRSISLIR